MKHKKSLTAVILVAVLLTFTVGGTIAYLMDGTEKVVNTFRPAKVDTKIVETIANDAKTSIAVENPKTDESIDAYVRVTVTGNWCDKDGKVVKAWSPAFEYNSGAWDKVQEGDLYYYYYKSILKVGKTTANLLDEGATISMTVDAPEGCHLEVTVMQQAIQAEGMGVNTAQAAFAKAAQ